jgi:hypothetical protein
MEGENRAGRGFKPFPSPEPEFFLQEDSSSLAGFGLEEF